MNDSMKRTRELVLSRETISKNIQDLTLKLHEIDRSLNESDCISLVLELERKIKEMKWSNKANEIRVEYLKWSLLNLNYSENDLEEAMNDISDKVASLRKDEEEYEASRRST